MHRRFLIPVAAALVLVAAAVFMLRGGGGGGTIGAGGELADTFFRGFDFEELASITAEWEGADPLEFVKGDDGEWLVVTPRGPRAMEANLGWRLFKSRARDTEVEYAADVVGRRVGTNVEKHGEFGFDDTAPRVTWKDAGGNVLETLDISSRGTATAGGTFVRRPGAAEVHEIPIPIRDNFGGRTAYQWRRKMAFENMRGDAIQRFEVTNIHAPKLSYVLTKSGEKDWLITSDSLEGEQEARTFIVMELMSQFMYARATEFLSEEEEAALTDADWLFDIKALDADGALYAGLKVGRIAGENRERFAIASTIPDAFLLEKSTDLVKRPYDYLKRASN